MALKTSTVGPSAKPCGQKADATRWDGIRTGIVKGNGQTRNIRSVWSFAPGHFRGGHFAVVPPEMARRCLAAGSRVGDWALDPFGGSGTTGMVAQQMGREATLVELNPDYEALIRRRLAL